MYPEDPRLRLVIGAPSLLVVLPLAKQVQVIEKRSKKLVYLKTESLLPEILLECLLIQQLTLALLIISALILMLWPTHRHLLHLLLLLLFPIGRIRVLFPLYVLLRRHLKAVSSPLSPTLRSVIALLAILTLTLLSNRIDLVLLPALLLGEVLSLLLYLKQGVVSVALLLCALPRLLLLLRGN